jgi:hypothetical protein
MSAMLGRSSGDAASQWARHQLEQSSDAAVLYAAGINLTRMAAGSHPRLASTENHLFGLEILERANRLDPNLAERAEARLTDRDAFKQAAFVTAGVGPRMLEVIDGFYPLAAFDGAPQKAWPDMLATSTGVQRLRRLAGFAQNEFATAERRDWMATQPSAGKDPSDRASQNENRLAAREMFARSKAYAREAIELGGSLKADAQTADALFRAHLAYGLNALREKDRTRAVEHLLAASMFRPATSVDSGDSLETKLVNYLLKNGERKAVIEYLERGAVRREKPARDEMLEAAAAIRAGMMPARYQRAVAFGHV